MKDKFGRELTYLRISVVDRCNLRCVYCLPHGTPAGERTDLLSIDEIVEAASLYAELGIRKIRVTGGEPLVRSGVPSLVGRLKRLPGIREVVMTTNGVLLERYADELALAGLDRINVSLDTLDAETFRKVTGFDKLADVLRGIDAAWAAGIGPIKLNVVLMKGVNDAEIHRLLNFAVQRGLEVRFIEWMPTSAETFAEREKRFFSCEDARRIVEERRYLSPDDSDPHSPARAFFVDGGPSRVGFISPLSNAFCAGCNRLRLKANGMMKTCLHGKEDLDLKALLRGGASREEILNRIAETVFDRPEEHFLNRAVPHRDFQMTAVGG